MFAGGVVVGVVVGVGRVGGVGVEVGVEVGVGRGVRRLVEYHENVMAVVLAHLGWLAFRHRLPWSLMGFLADAHQRGVLRQVGVVYQFRHIDLQHRLATRS